MKRQDTITMFENAIKDSGGIINTIAKRLNRKDYFKVKKKIFNNKKLKDLYLAEVEKISDIAESNIIKSILNGDVNISKWYLLVKAKERGYIEQQKIDFEASINIDIIKELENIFKK